MASHRKLAALVGHTSSSGRLDFSPDDRLLATPHGNGTILLWDLGSRTIVGTLAGHQGLVISVRFSPDGQLLASSGIDGTVRLWHVPSRRPVATLGSHQGAVYSIAFSPDGSRLISGGLDHTARLWDIQRRRAVTTFRGHLSRIFSVSYAPDGKTVATASLDGTARTWDATAPADTDIFDRHAGAVAYVRFSPDGRLLARSVLSSSQVTLWDARSWKKLAVIPHANAGFSPKAPLLATTSPPNALAFWDVSQEVPTPRMTVALPSSPLAAVPGAALFSGWGPCRCRVWAICGGGYLGCRGSSVGCTARARRRTGAARCYAFSPDGRSLAIGDQGGRVHQWNAATWEKSGVLDGHSGRIEAVAFSPDGRLLATGSEDTTVRLWSTSPGSEPAAFRGDAGAGAVARVLPGRPHPRCRQRRRRRQVLERPCPQRSGHAQGARNRRQFARVRPGWSDAGDDLGRRDDAPVESAWLRRDRPVTLGQPSRELGRGPVAAFGYDRGIMSTASDPKVSKAGLEDVVATSSGICFIDGDRGVLAYRGYDIHDLATHATFEEVCYLLWHGRLPTRAELENCSRVRRRAPAARGHRAPASIAAALRRDGPAADPRRLRSRTTMRTRRTTPLPRTTARPSGSPHNWAAWWQPWAG